MLRLDAIFEDSFFDYLENLMIILNKKNRTPSPNFFKNLDPIDLSSRKVIGDFITNNSDLAEELKATEKIIDAYYRKTNIKRPLNILLSASPGSGKSFLLKQFKEKLHTDYIEFNLSTLISKEEVFNIFRYIKDKNASGKIPIVFIDEVDTQINNEYIFPLLISAMSDGNSRYIREDIDCSKAIIAFAGSGLFERNDTNFAFNSSVSKYRILFNLVQEVYRFYHKKTYFEWSEEKVNNLKRSAYVINKFSDFLDRIDLFLMLPPTYLQLKNYSILTTPFPSNHQLSFLN
jgi:hypothetical protein